VAGRNRRAAPGEPACGVDGCPRPAGLGTWHVGAGPCLRHGGDRWSAPKDPPGWWGTGEATPYATLLRRLAAAKLAAQPFPLAWAGALYDTLYGLPADDFREWAGVLLPTSRAWLDAYTGRRTPLRRFDASYVEAFQDLIADPRRATSL
jgi:hypothetical protein